MDIAPGERCFAALVLAARELGGTGMSLTTTWARAYMRDVSRALQQGDWEEYRRLHHPDVTHVSPIFKCVGIDEFVRRNKSFREAVHDWTLRVVAATVDPVGHLAAYELIQTGTLNGDLETTFGVAKATRERFELASAAFVTFDDHGRARAIRSYFDLESVGSASRRPAT